MSGLYIHIPFCKQACSYCDFYFVTRQQHKQDFVDELIREIHAKKDSVFTEEPVRSIYFGGGTPSLLTAEQVNAILDSIRDVFDTDLKEITLEMNPDDVSREYLAGLRSAGINRASMGVQSFNPELLKFMNRAHTSEEALKCLEILEASEFKVFTVDVIYGNPGQSLDILEQDLDTILEFNPPHISAYSLTIEPHTRLGKQVKLGRITPPEDDTVSDHFDLVVDKLAAAGIQQYEVSNYAKPGSEAVHNSNYWSHENYLGLGPGAHSFWWNEDHISAIRWNNRSNLNAYLNGDWKEQSEREELNLADLAEERLMLGLRTKMGLEKNELKSTYHFEFNDRQLHYLEKLEESGKAKTGGRIHLTKDGLKIADSILLDLITMT
ncbi:MAG: radical SAM family heme chaperone HemW [Gracilimonas sp.]|uniref:radical SAM family heme chaperone HemW n=1 Tax=Gracilimonas TaxID=649462 RepID=UPI001B05DE53|nr:radical SAM family heme chaperone HemW [Gracilimonas sp.]MBO6584668.1 radical SAM family heme chaperone HemW [Gracilimonas sp.]MBO6616061.1 radical SAM family heme chaperone HemW [Gracilimonas sp.]